MGRKDRLSDEKGRALQSVLLDVSWRESHGKREEALARMESYQLFKDFAAALIANYRVRGISSG